MCGRQTIDVTDSVQTFNMTSQQFNTGYFCIYQFRQTAFTNKVIVVQVDYQGTDLTF